MEKVLFDTELTCCASLNATCWALPPYPVM